MGATHRAGKKRASNSGSKKVLGLIQQAYERAMSEEEVLFPVISYYGAGRIWLPHNERSGMKSPTEGPARRWAAFYDCLNERVRISDLTRWFEAEAIAAVNRGGQFRAGFEAVRHAVLQAIPIADAIRYDGDRKEIVLSIDRCAQPMSNLSAGQQTMLALIADIAVKAVTQNSYLLPPNGSRHDEDDRGLPRVLAETPGVVLIDELDVHLHPKWQRGVVESLRNTFPKIQFIATTHSPFIVQSLRPDELINLDGQTVPELGNLSVQTIAQGLMGVERPEVSQRYEKMVEAARDYLVTLDEAATAPADRLAEYEQRLARGIAPFADNPAFQAFLELKHAAKLGNRDGGA